MVLTLGENKSIKLWRKTSRSYYTYHMVVCQCEQHLPLCLPQAWQFYHLLSQCIEFLYKWLWHVQTFCLTRKYRTFSFKWSDSLLKSPNMYMYHHCPILKNFKIKEINSTVWSPVLSAVRDSGPTSCPSYNLWVCAKMLFTSNTPSNFGIFFSKPLSDSKTI